MEGKETIGEAAEREAQKYFEMYKRFKVDQIVELRERAETLALSDLYKRSTVTGFAIERLEELIKKDKEEEMIE